MLEETHFLFIYGTLRKGCRAFSYMEGAEYLTKASIVGQLHYVDRYPGLSLGGTSLVYGEVYKVDTRHLELLDDYEGCNETPPDYLRIKVEVKLENGSTMEVETYVFQLIETAKFILNTGDWLEFVGTHSNINC